MTGCMYFNNNPRKSLEEKVVEAAVYYRNKYHLEPDTCMVHPQYELKPSLIVNGITVKPCQEILPNNFWIGQEQSEKKTVEALASQQAFPL